MNPRSPAPAGPQNDNCVPHNSRVVAICLSNTCGKPPECCIACLRDHYATCDQRLIVDLTQAPKKILYAPNTEAAQLYGAKLAAINARLQRAHAETFSQNNPQPNPDTRSARYIKENFAAAVDGAGTIIMTRKTPAKFFKAAEMLDHVARDIDVMLSSNVVIAPAPQAPTRTSGILNAPPMGPQPVRPPSANIKPQSVPQAPVPVPPALIKQPNPYVSPEPMEQKIFDINWIGVLDQSLAPITFKLLNQNILVTQYSPEAFIIFKKHFKALKLLLRVNNPRDCVEKDVNHFCLFLDANAVRDKIFQSMYYSRAATEYGTHTITQAARKIDGTLAKFNQGFYITFDEAQEMLTGSFVPAFDPAHLRYKFEGEDYHMCLNIKAGHPLEIIVEILEFRE